MKIKVKVYPNSKKDVIDGFKDSILHIRVSSSADKGKANLDVINLIADHYNITKKNIKILSGNTSRLKLIEINTN